MHIALKTSVAHRAEDFRQALETHLSLLRRQGHIAVWHDRNITAGTTWAQAIDTHLRTAQIILLLISADFLASDYCVDTEMAHALERHAAGSARVIPIIVRPADWHSAPFGALQALPTDGKAITSWPNLDEAWLNVAQGLRRVLGEMRGRP